MHKDFYLPEDPDYSLIDSARDSTRFAHLCLQPTERGRWRAPSSCVNPVGNPSGTGALTDLEGPGWGADALGGAADLLAWGRYDHCHLLEHVAMGLADHVLYDGFVTGDGFITAYRHTPTGELCLNARRMKDWFCPGWVARNALEMLWLSDGLAADDPHVSALRGHATRCGEWLAAFLPEGSWYPRRCTPQGEAYARVADGSAPDPLADSSGDGLHIAWLFLELTVRGASDYAAHVRAKLDVLIARRGIYGSVAPDGYDSDDSAARAVTCRMLLRAARVFEDTRMRDFALADALAGLDACMVIEDVEGVATKGLVRTSERRRGASMWDNAEIAMAYLEAVDATGDWNHANCAATILRAIARQHAGEHGFLAGRTDWSGSDAGGSDAALCTGPLAGNLHHVAAVARYGEMHATVL